MPRLADRVLRKLQRSRHPETIRGFEGIAPQQLPADADELTRLFYAHRGPIIHKWTHYLPVYHRHFERFRGSRVRILELGVSEGGSLQLWRDYFGPAAVIYGVDINPRCAAFSSRGVQVRIGSQADPKFLRAVVAEMGGVDIVIDDGSHVAQDQRISFQTLFPLVDARGLYVAEDLHTAYWYDYGGGYGRKQSFIELAKSLVDDLHSWYHSRPSKYPDAARVINAVHFYDSIAVIEKAPKEKPVHLRVGVAPQLPEGAQYTR